MLNSVQRFAVAVARAAGFHPIGPAWIPRLLALQGEFQRSTSERVFWYVFEMFAVGCGAWIVGFCVRDYASCRFTQWPLGLMGLAILAAGLFAITRNGRCYRIEHGVLTALRSNGQPAWQEQLAGLTGVMMIRGRGGFVTTLVLRWPDHTRRLELFRSLDAALSAHDP